MSTPPLTSDNTPPIRHPISGTARSTSDRDLRIVHHALGVKLALELRDHVAGRRELDALLDTIAEAETRIVQLTRKVPA